MLAENFLRVLETKEGRVMVLTTKYP